MTIEELNSLKPGDIVEFRGEVAYGLDKLVKRKDDVWYGTNHGSEITALSIVKYPEDFILVGHSDYFIKPRA